MNDHQKWHIEQKAIYLREAYKLALEKWGNQVNWMSICTEAIDRVKEFGYSSVTSPRTVMDYNKAFRKDGLFPHPSYTIRLGKPPTPQVFEHFPQLPVRIKEFMLITRPTSDLSQRACL